ncbi:MAG: hypothetical protein ACRENS_11685, partial [Candidatus Eiseniibacteriota bacterium]
MHLRVRKPLKQTSAIRRRVSAGFRQRGLVRLDCTGEVVGGEMQITDRFMLSCRLRKRVLGMRQIRGDSSLH